MLLPLQGVWGVWVPFTQGAALGYVLLPLRGVPLVSFDHPPPTQTNYNINIYRNGNN